MNLYLTAINFKSKTKQEKLESSVKKIIKSNLKPKNESLEKTQEAKGKKLNFSNDSGLNNFNNQIKKKSKRAKSQSLINFFPNKIKIEKKKQEENLFKKSENNFVDYMIQDQTKFADLNKIEDYFKRQIHEKIKTFDKNKIQILQKQKEFEILEKQIEKELIGNADIDYDFLREEYEEIKNSFMEKIRIKEYDFLSMESEKNILIKDQVKYFIILITNY